MMGAVPLTRGMRIRSDSLSGARGVTRMRYGKWAARIFTNGRSEWLGEYATREEAVEARRSAEIKTFGEFSPTTSRKESGEQQ